VFQIKFEPLRHSINYSFKIFTFLLPPEAGSDQVKILLISYRAVE